MFSLLKFGWLSAWRLHLPSLLLPLLALSSTFSSSQTYPYSLFNQIISATFIACCIVVFYRACRYKILAAGIPVALVFLRLARFGDENSSGVVQIIYFIPYGILLLGVGAKMLRDYPLLLFRQIIWICIISILLSVMQMMGVQWALSLTNYYSVSGGSSEYYLFTPWADLGEISSMQIRPVGFASANNIVSQYLMFFYAFAIAWFMDDRQRLRPPLMWLLIISFCCALSGSKVVIGGIFLSNVAALVFVGGGMQVARIFLVSCLGYFCYWLLFPGLFVYNYNIDLFAFNAMIRLADLMGYGGVPYLEDISLFLSNYQTGDYIGERSLAGTLDEMSGTTISGIGSVITYLPVIISAGLVLAPLWIVRLRRLARTRYVDVRKLAIIMLVGTVAGSAGGPFLFTSYFWFFSSFALYPLSVLLLRESQSVWRSHPRRAAPVYSRA